jgi:hypothetical protein
VHQAVEQNVRVRSRKCAERYRAHAEILEPQQSEQRQGELSHEGEQDHEDQPRDRSTDVRVKEPMERVLTRDHVVQRLDVDEHVGAAEREEADVLRRG